MRKKAKYLLLTLLLFLVTTSVKAEECDYARQVELNTEASTVKATYEEVEIDTGETLFAVDEDGIIDTDVEVPVVKKGFNVKLLNLTKNLYVKVETDDSVNEIFNYSDSENGTLIIATVDADKVRTFKILIGSAEEDCSIGNLRTITLVTPKYNTYSQSDFCNQYPDFEYCQEFTTNLDISYSDFLQSSDSYKQKRDDTTKVDNKEINSFIKKNKKTIIIISSIVVIVGVATAAVIVIRRRSRLI